MGQANARRKQFGIGAHDVATYIETEVVTAYKADPDGQVRQAAIMVHAAARSIATSFHPDRDPRLQERLLETDPGYGSYPEESILLVDPDSFAILRSMPIDEFDRDYSWIPGTVSYARNGGKETKVAISADGVLVIEGGVAIKDPVAFARGKLRKAGRLPIPADHPFSFQLMNMFLFPGLDTDDAHLPHVLALCNATVPTLPDLQATANADISVLDHIADIVEERGDNGSGMMPDLVSLTSVIGTLVHMVAADCPLDGFSREYCRVSGLPLTVFHPRTPEEETEWEDLSGVLDTASKEAGMPTEIGEKALRTSVGIPSMIADGLEPVLEAIDALFAKGLTRFRYVAPAGGTVEVMDFPGRTVMTLTMPGEVIEIVTWTDETTPLE